MRAALENLFLAITFAEAGEVDEARRIVEENRFKKRSARQAIGSIGLPEDTAQSLFRSGEERRFECK